MTKNAARLLVNYVAVTAVSVGVYLTYALPGLVFADAGVMLAVYGLVVLVVQTLVGR